jgi:predicted Zn-dependent protease
MSRSPTATCWKTSLTVMLLTLACSTAQAGPASPAGPDRANQKNPHSEIRPPQCDDDPDCGEAVQQALSQSNAQEYQAALTTYRGIYARWPTPWLLINMGRVEQKMGRPSDAIATYQRYLDVATNDKPDRVRVARAYMEQAKKELEVSRYKQMLSDEKAAKPIYQKWWFWTALAGTVLVAAGVTTAVVLATRPAAIAPDRAVSVNVLYF